MNVKGSYYENGALEPIDVIDAWGLGFSEGSIVKYLARWRHKDGHPEVLLRCVQNDVVPSTRHVQDSPHVRRDDQRRKCLAAYCMQDVRAERGLCDLLRKLSQGAA